MNKLITMTVIGATLLTFAGCATAPKRDDNLESARSVVTQVESAPLAGEVAADEVEQAHLALRKADDLASKHAANNEIDHQAYLARRHAEIAQQQIAIAQAKKTVAEGESQRQKVVLEAEAARKTEQARLQALQTAEATQRADSLEKQLADLNAKKTDRGVVLTLGDVLFDTGKATLKPGAQSTIDRLANFLKSSPDSSVVIEGHTDSVGSDDYNLELSQRRAESVRSALLSRSVTGERVSAIGKGKSEPVAGNETAAGRQQNRRVEIVIQNAKTASG